MMDRFKLSKTKRRLLLAIAAAACLASCSGINYYAQAAHGQLSLLADARPVDDWLADASTDAKLRERLASARQIRRFAVEHLGLPDNASYRNYAALKRPYVLWNVVAAPELSLVPREWCFPVAGCVNYRGYYAKQGALDFARELRAGGDDVQVGGVPAYSTLGWFNDPLISTFIHYPDAELARLIFHELSHQVVYAPGDSQFNESFASAVEEAGVERWLAAHGNDAMRAKYAAFSVRKADFIGLLLKIRRALEQNYASAAPVEQKRAAKARLFQQLTNEYQELKRNWGGYAGYDRFFAEPLSNAHLASVATYNDFVPAFRALRAREGGFPGLYAAVRELAGLSQEERHRRLHQIGGTTAPPKARAAPQQ
ncbi:aminopeptidase [Massilia glaciei]|nr:aminopeptidase [Massilia glaciei]